MTIDRNRLDRSTALRQIRWALHLSVGLVIALGGCSSAPPHFVIKDKVVDGEKPVLPDSNTSIQMVFVQQVDVEKPFNTYATRLNPEDGSFEMTGNELTGMPAGKYRVKLNTLSLKPSPLANFINTRFQYDNSPILIDVVDDKTPIVIDIAPYRKK